MKSTKKGSRSINEFITRIRVLATSLDAIGDRVSDHNLVDVVLDGLPEEYNSLILFAFSKPDVLDLSELESPLLVQKEQLDKFCQEIATPSVSANLVHTTARGAHAGGRFGKGRYGHGRGCGRARGPPPANCPTCHVCNKPGPIALDRWYRYDEFYTPQAPAPAARNEPTTQNPATQNTTQQQASTSDSGDVTPHALAAYTTFDPTTAENFTIPPDVTQGWFADTCASHNFTSVSQYLHTSVPYTGAKQVYMGNGHPVTIKSVGTSTLYTTHNPNLSFTLKNLI